MKPRVLRFAKHVLQDAGRFLRPGRIQEDSFSTAPHPVALYRDTLAAYREAGDAAMLSFEDALLGRVHPDKVNMVVRHDVDNDPQKLAAMCEQELALGLRSDIFVIVKQKPELGGCDYDFREWVGLLEDLRRQGFGVGLHTVCWAQEDIAGFFDGEVKAFEDAFGWSPRIFTLHGFLGSQEETLSRRQRYFGMVDQLLAEHPSLAGHEHQVPIEWFLTDSRHYGQGSRWPLVPPSLRKFWLGRTVMICTHPEHWC